jgi:hypothetical protein
MSSQPHWGQSKPSREAASLLRFKRERQLVELAVEGKWRLVICIVQAGSGIGPTSKVSLASKAKGIV